MKRSLANTIWYGFMHFLCRLFFVAVHRLRVRGRHFEPEQGGVLVLSNHQSHLDPALIGASCRRRLNYLARDTLFRFAPFGWLISSLDAIPIQREGVGLAGLKETLRRLKRGEMVLIFPEGTRSPNGELGKAKPGFCALARRTKVSLLPVAIEGAYDAWPRRHRFPRPAPIQIQFGEPIPPDTYQDLDDDQLVAMVQAAIAKCHTAARLASPKVVVGRQASHPTPPLARPSHPASPQNQARTAIVTNQPVC